MKVGLEKFNNNTAPQVAADSQARFGCKGKDRDWFAYKEHVSVEMQSGLINKVAATSAEVMDADGLAHVCPDGGAVFGDKGDCLRLAQRTFKRKGGPNATIKKTTGKTKITVKMAGFLPGAHPTSVCLLIATKALVIGI